MSSFKAAQNLITNATRFSEIGLRGNLVSALEKHYQIVHPTVAQKAFIPAILSGGDLFIRDLTGSGKTFGLSLAAVAYPRFMTAHRHDQLVTSADQIKEGNINDKVHRGKTIYDEAVIHDQNQDQGPDLDTEEHGKLQFTGTEKIKREQDRYIHTLMMVPTRDLAVQVFDWIKGFTRSYIHGDDVAYMVQCIISGPDVESQKELLKKFTPRIVVGTPNRLLELYNSQDLDFSRLRLLIIDEADRIVKSTSSHAPVKKRFNAKIHKADGELLLEKLFNSEKKGKLSKC
jgi:superfamily II DNA/RNA helicase